MNQYEAMFLFDPTFGGSFENCEAEIRRLMERAEAEIVFCRLWDERRLAYKIKGRKRGVYVLVYFKSSPQKITPLERDARLSENILRMMVLRADDMTPEAMEKAVTDRPEERTGDQGRGHRYRDRRGRDQERPAEAEAGSGGAKTAVAEKEPEKTSEETKSTAAD